MKRYDIGDVARIGMRFMRNGALVDPATVTVKIKDPAATTNTYTYAAAEINKTATGIYYIEVPVDSAGVWSYRILTTTPTSAQQGTWLAVPKLIS